MSRPKASPGPTCNARGAQLYGYFSASGSLPSIISSLKRQTLSDHFQKEDDWVHPQELPRGSKCFDWQYMLEYYYAESQQPNKLQTLPNKDNELETEEYHPPSEHADSWGPFSGYPIIITPVYSDKEPRGLQCTGHEVQIKSCKVLELDNQPRHLQVLKNKQINVPLIAVRNLLYKGMLQKVRRRQSPCRQIVQQTIKTPSNERQHKKLVLIKDIQYTVGLHNVAFGQPVQQKIRIYAQE
ncbi:hypothetical protein V8F44DRAFT_633050 [Aspergillus fumigatus]